MAVVRATGLCLRLSAHVQVVLLTVVAVQLVLLAWFGVSMGRLLGYLKVLHILTFLGLLMATRNERR